MTKQKAQHPKNCQHCNTQFVPQRSTALYCSRSCNDGARNAKVAKKTAQANARKAARRKLTIPNTSFFQWIFRECKRAGTVEILTNTSLEGLLSLRERCTKASGFTDGKYNQNVFELSHICPASGHSQLVGLLHPQNLVIAPASFNRERGTKHTPGAGEFLSRHNLKDIWKVEATDSVRSIQSKVERFLGKAVLEHFLSDYKLKIAYKDKLIRKLSGIQQLPESDYKNWSVSDLEDELEDAGFKIGSNYTLRTEKEWDVAREEMARFSSYQGSLQAIPDLNAFLGMYRESVDGSSNVTFPLRERDYFERISLDMVWKLLHGDGKNFTIVSDTFFQHAQMNVFTSDPKWQPTTHLDKLYIQRMGYNNCVTLIHTSLTREELWDLDLPQW